MRIAITGSSGLIGSALARSLEADGHEVLRVVRSAGRAAGPGSTVWDPEAGVIDASAFEGLDGVVHLAGEPIASRRWSEQQKRKIMGSRTQGTGLLAEALSRCEVRPPVLVSGSGVDFYGDRGDEELTEDSGPGEGFLTDVTLAWEGATAPAEEAGVRVARIRTAMVLDAHDGALATMLPPFKLGIGGRVGSGRQWMSWITLTDHVRAIRFLLEHDLAGPVNLAAPGPVTNAEFTRALGAVLHRPTVLPVPLFVPKLRFGAELVETLLLTSHRVVPRALLDAGFEFRHPELDGALRATLARGS